MIKTLLPELEQAEFELIASGKKILAIKAYHNRTGTCVNLSKIFIEEMHDELINMGHRKNNPV